MRKQLSITIFLVVMLIIFTGLNAFAEGTELPASQVTDDSTEPVIQPADEMEHPEGTQDPNLTEEPDTSEIPEDANLPEDAKEADDTEDSQDADPVDTSPIMKLIMARIQNWNGLQKGELERIALVVSKRLNERLHENWSGDLSEESIEEVLDELLETLNLVLVDAEGNIPEMSEEDTESIAELISGTVVLLDAGITHDDILEFARKAIEQNVDAQGIKQIANTVSGFARELIEEGEIDDPEVLQERLRERLEERFQKISTQREKVAEAHQRSEEKRKDALERAEEKREEALRRAEEKREQALEKGNKDIEEIEEKAHRERERAEAKYEKSLDKMDELQENDEDDPGEPDDEDLDELEDEPDEDEASDEEEPAVEEEPIQSDSPKSNRIREGRD
jgi:hypothetical protein